MSVVKCRNCGETGHWSRNCTSTPMTTVSATATSAATESSALMSGSSTGLYVAKHRRIGAGAGAASAGEFARDDANTLRVQNLPSDTTKTDLGDLFGKFGRTTRIGGDGSRGFAFVTFVMRRDAELALTALHKFKYGNLVLSVEWAAVRKGT
jgi:translation initiation factor 3 subunit G